MIGISLICTTSFPQSSPIHSCIRMVHTVAVVLLFCHSCYHDKATESLNINGNKIEFIYSLGIGRYAFTMIKLCGKWIAKNRIFLRISMSSHSHQISYIFPQTYFQIKEHPVFNLNGFMYTWIGRLLLLPRLPPQFYFC